MTDANTIDWTTYADQVLDALTARSMVHSSITRDDLDDMRQAAIAAALEAIAKGSHNWRVAGRYGAMRWQRDELRHRGYTISRGRCLPGSALPKRQSMPADMTDGDSQADPPASIIARDEVATIAGRIARLSQPGRAVCLAVARGQSLASAARAAGVSRHAARRAVDEATGRRSPVPAAEGNL